MGFLCFFLNNKTCSFQKTKKNGLKNKNPGGLVFFEKSGFFSTLIIFQSLCDFPLIA